MTEPEYGSDEYLLQKWEHLLGDIGDRSNKLLLAKMLENHSGCGKSPLQILAEEGNRILDNEDEAAE